MVLVKGCRCWRIEFGRDDKRLQTLYYCHIHGTSTVDHRAYVDLDIYTVQSIRLLHAAHILSRIGRGPRQPSKTGTALRLCLVASGQSSRSGTGTKYRRAVSRRRRHVRLLFNTFTSPVNIIRLSRDSTLLNIIQAAAPSQDVPCEVTRTTSTATPSSCLSLRQRLCGAMGGGTRSPRRFQLLRTLGTWRDVSFDRNKRPK